MSTVEGARSSPTSPKSKFDPEISMSESNSPYQTVITAVSPPRRGSGSMLVRYFEQVKKTVEEFIEDVGYAEMRPDHDLDPDESDVRLRVAAARIPRIQQRLNNLSEKEATLTKSLLDQGIEDPHHLMEKIETIVDSFERSQQSLHQKLANRPNLRQDLLPSLPIATTQDVGSYAVTPVKSVDDYDATKHVDPKFDGDKSDPECLQKFSSWKSAWDSAHATLRTLEGYSSKAAFKHLESVLTGEALKKIRLINRSGGTYELAINKLESFFGNKLGLAANYLTSVGEFEGSNLNMAAVIQDSVVGLESLQDTFVEDKVDPFQFSIIHHLQTLMESRPTMAESWLHFKKRRHEEFLAQQIGEKWHPSIVENSTSFKAWLDTFRANRPTAKSMNSKVKPSARGSLSRGLHRPKKVCFVCRGDHRPFQCPTAVSFTYTEWFQICKTENKCQRCLIPWTSGHVCESLCSFCGRGHNKVLCPENRNRKKISSVTKRPRSPSSRTFSSKVSRGRSRDRTSGEPRDRNRDRSNDRICDRSNDRICDRSNDRIRDRSNDRIRDRSNDRIRDRIASDRDRIARERDHIRGRRLSRGTSRRSNSRGARVEQDQRNVENSGRTRHRHEVSQVRRD
ncbi:uncharacterized protein LOC131890858 [Tigriopus californicus]|uniref:uncharacterized protein LOC131890858 n=1 Tax=Tigriopus californicus TaxID=6832 RepID=UPI0027DAB0A0|nr:uncharacterized protein LOC131890858 [Tigriopus californicus]